MAMRWKTASKLEEDPYRLLSFCASWRDVDQLARIHFGVPVDDPRRLMGAVEEACYRIFSAGHTSALSATLMSYLKGVLGAQKASIGWASLVHKALDAGLTNGSFVIGPHGIQPLGAMVMEKNVALAISGRICCGDEGRLLPQPTVDTLLLAHETSEGITLNVEQRAAVHLASVHKFALITGGAGVGKTTVLKALYRIFDEAGIEIIQLALAGRAAKRMQEATSRPAFTIASFLKAGSQAARPCVAVVDEASMIDIITMNRLCEKLGTEPRLLLVGDTAQLMPVGPGLVLHALAQVDFVPLVSLKSVKRYGATIATAAQAIRDGVWPALSTDPSEPISFMPAVLNEVFPEIVLDLYRLEPASTQILCARRNGHDGAKTINALCQQRLTKEAKPVMVWSVQHDAHIHTGLHLGDPVLCTRNLWDRGIQNGSLGKIVQVEDQPRLVPTSDPDIPEFALAWIEWDDGVRRPLVEAILDDIELGYAITVHKAQGSQWPRVVVPLTGHRLLDRTLIYTAVTRAQSQVILIGDEQAVCAAVKAPPRASTRHVALDLVLRTAYSSTLDQQVRVREHMDR